MALFLLQEKTLVTIFVIVFFYMSRHVMTGEISAFSFFLILF